MQDFGWRRWTRAGPSNILVSTTSAFDTGIHISDFSRHSTRSTLSWGGGGEVLHGQKEKLEMDDFHTKIKNILWVVLPDHPCKVQAWHCVWPTPLYLFGKCILRLVSTGIFPGFRCYTAWWTTSIPCFTIATMCALS